MSTDAKRSRVSNYVERGSEAFSYNVCIRTQLADGTWVLNTTDYSEFGSTTGKHQQLARKIIVDEVVAGKNPTVIEVGGLPIEVTAAMLMEAGRKQKKGTKK